MSSRSVSIAALILLTLAKEEMGMSLRTNTVCNFQTMKSAVKLNRPLLKFVLLCQVDIQESFCGDNVKFNFLGIILESKRSVRVNFSGF